MSIANETRPSDLEIVKNKMIANRAWSKKKIDAIPMKVKMNTESITKPETLPLPSGSVESDRKAKTLGNPNPNENPKRQLKIRERIVPWKKIINADAKTPTIIDELIRILRSIFLLTMLPIKTKKAPKP